MRSGCLTGPGSRAWLRPCRSKSLTVVLQAEVPGSCICTPAALTGWQDWEEVFSVNWERCQGWGVPKFRLCVPQGGGFRWEAPGCDLEGWTVRPRSEPAPVQIRRR